MDDDRPIRLRPVDSDDLAFTCRWRNDPLIRALTLARPGSTTPEMEAAWFATIDDGPRPHDVYRLVVAASSDERIGLVMLRDIDWDAREASFGIWIAGDHQGRGFGHAATSATLDYAFGTLGLGRVTLRVLADHDAAVRLYESCGFRAEGRTTEDARRDGAPVELLIMSCPAPTT